MLHGMMLLRAGLGAIEVFLPPIQGFAVIVEIFLVLLPAESTAKNYPDRSKLLVACFAEQTISALRCPTANADLVGLGFVSR